MAGPCVSALIGHVSPRVKLRIGGRRDAPAWIARFWFAGGIFIDLSLPAPLGFEIYSAGTNVLPTEPYC